MLSLILSFLGVLILAALGAGLGWFLATSAEKYAVDVDPLLAKVEDALPRANCAACAFPSCSVTAQAIIDRKVGVDVCVVGGVVVAEAVAALIGIVKPRPANRQGAVIRCKGFGADIARERYLFDGLQSCKLAHQTAGGFKECTSGCLAMGDCARACLFGALKMDDRPAPVVDLSMCTACGKCVTACPRAIIQLVSMQPQYMVSCISHEKGASTRSDCSVGCIACEKCVKVCEYEAITVRDNLAVIDPIKCVACGVCVKECPQHTIDYVDSTVALIQPPVEPSACTSSCATCEI